MWGRADRLAIRIKKYFKTSEQCQYLRRSSAGSGSSPHSIPHDIAQLITSSISAMSYASPSHQQLAAHYLGRQLPRESGVGDRCLCLYQYVCSEAGSLRAVPGFLFPCPLSISQPSGLMLECKEIESLSMRFSMRSFISNLASKKPFWSILLGSPGPRSTKEVFWSHNCKIKCYSTDVLMQVIN